MGDIFNDRELPVVSIVKLATRHVKRFSPRQLTLIVIALVLVAAGFATAGVFWQKNRSLTDQLTSTQQSIDDLQGQNDDLQSQNDDLNNQVQDLQSQVDDLQNQVDNLSNQLDSATSSVLVPSISDKCGNDPTFSLTPNQSKINSYHSCVRSWYQTYLPNVSCGALCGE